MGLKTRSLIHALHLSVVATYCGGYLSHFDYHLLSSNRWT